MYNLGKNSNVFRFIDKVISQYFYMGGTGVYVHKYLGPESQVLTGADPSTETVFTPVNPLFPNAAPTINERSIQDVLLLENRDRKYSSEVYELRGIYNVADLDFSMSQFALFMNNDTIFMEFHLNDIIASLGRRLIPNDVLELPHQRDDTIPNGLPAINKYYVVEEATRASGGYSVTWYPHIWRVKLSPMTASQEFESILQQTATDPLGFNTPNKLVDILSNYAIDQGINEQVFNNAVKQVPRQFFETRQYYLVGNQEGVYPNNPWLFTGGGDAIPPNGAMLLDFGPQLPTNANVGDYFLNTAYSPAALFLKSEASWCLQEVDWRGTEWSVANTLLKSFINNSNSNTYEDGLMLPERQYISQVLNPRGTFLNFLLGITETEFVLDSSDASVSKFTGVLEFLNQGDITDANLAIINIQREFVFENLSGHTTTEDAPFIFDAENEPDSSFNLDDANPTDFLLSDDGSGFLDTE